MTEGRPSVHQRAIVRERASGRCEYCQSQERFSPQAFSIEHIVPLHSGGESLVDNLALACQGCNNHKYIRTTATDPDRDEEVSLFHPRLHHWEEHFSWDDSYTRIVGVTAIGRATVQALQLNRVGLINLRRLLRNQNEHPPAVGRIEP